MTASIALTRGARLAHLPTGFALEHGGALGTAHVAFEIVGPPDAPVVAVLGGISAHRRVCAGGGAGWWSGFVGPGGAIDTRRVRVLGIDWVGGCDGSTGPAPEQRDFPAVDAADQARALFAVCDALGVRRLHAIVGASYGGMVALHAAALRPERIGRLVVVGAADRSLPWITAQRVVQRRIVRLGIENGTPRESLALARALGMTSYRSVDELTARFDAPGELGVANARFPVEGWLDAHGTRFVERFTPAAYLCLSESIDRHRIEPRRVTVPGTYVGLRGDLVAPPETVRALAARVRASARYAEVDSSCGHDGFLKDVDAVAPIVREALGGEGAR